jgi:predicted 3-demethylubiquinone-9 3-methyltransferase (glyoxalase superfamily)
MISARLAACRRFDPTKTSHGQRKPVLSPNESSNGTAYLGGADGDENVVQSKGQKMAKNTICIWYDKDAEAAARFYAETFPDSAVGAVRRAPGDYPSGKKGDVLTVEFKVAGVACIGLNGGPAFKHNEAFSFQIATDDQTETDRYWNAIVGNGGQESACGWCKDKWGVSWQITPRVLIEAMAADGDEAKRAFDAMMTMKKIDVAAIKAARRG